METPMSNEKRKVLEMLAAGRITAEDAERLLNRLGTAPRITAGEGSDSGDGEPETAKRPLRYLRVVVDSSEGDKVNIRVPLALVRTGIKLSTMLPAEAADTLRERGVDLSELQGLKGEELIEALRELQVDVDSTEGDVVRVFCE